jgi:hypothetical protein
MMIPADSDHALRIVVLLLAPRRIEVVPGEIRAAAARHRAAESDLLPKRASDCDRRLAIHPAWVYPLRHRLPGSAPPRR